MIPKVYWGQAAAIAVSWLATGLRASAQHLPPAPSPENIVISRLPLPPISPGDKVGACTTAINPHGTGCLAKESSLHSGHFLPDNKHVLAVANFTGAPESPDPASIYQGTHLLVIKTDDTTFSNGDAWKCITCGVTEQNSRGRDPSLDYPQAFQDGTRALLGPHVVECPESLTADSCGPDTVRLIPLRWNNTVDGSGPRGQMRELRLHPDNVHIGFSWIRATAAGVTQGSFIGRMSYDPAPTLGDPLVPRYDVTDVRILYNEQLTGGLMVDTKNPNELIFKQGIQVGELRGFSGTGDEVSYLGGPVESCNIDVFAASISGAGASVRRLTAHPEYVDPVDLSPDGKWSVVLDTRGTDRQMFMAGLRGIPPLIDNVVGAAVATVRNNGKRRFFSPWLMDQYGDRGEYFGQKLNGDINGELGSGDIDDPNWNARADPRWSWDGSKVVYTEIITLAPACGGDNPLPCFESTEDGGRAERVMLAHLANREPRDYTAPAINDNIASWGQPFEPGSVLPIPRLPPSGEYTLRGKASGWANVILEMDSNGFASSIAVEYHNFSDDGVNVLVGTESASGGNPSPLVEEVHWFSNLSQTGPWNGTKVTSEGGFHLRIDIDLSHLESNGTLVTTVNGKEYLQPADGT